MSKDLWSFVERAADDDGVTRTDVVLNAVVRDLRERYPYEDIPER